MSDDVHVKAWMGGRCILIPIEDYYEMQAILHGFESYDDLRSQGLMIAAPTEVYDENGKPVSGLRLGDEGEGREVTQSQ